jgi:hypothetical protein
MSRATRLMGLILGAREPSRAVALIDTGAGLLAVSVVSLGIGLPRAR